MSNDIRELNISALDAVRGAAYNLGNIPGWHGLTLKKSGTVGSGETIDGVSFGGTAKDGSWGILNNSLPGIGNWGN